MYADARPKNRITVPVRSDNDPPQGPRWTTSQAFFAGLYLGMAAGAIYATVMASATRLIFSE